jgi:succinate dehydrogenase / fumarate reductase cytochrome b subunit
MFVRLSERTSYMAATAPAKVATTAAAQLTGTSIGKKILVAVTGFVSFGYIVGHLAGNLQIFIGPDQINAYAEALHSLGPGLWVIRIVLLVFFVTHIWLGIQLKAENWIAKPQTNQKQKRDKSTIASRTMIYTGLLILAFFVYHILQFTARVTDSRFEHLAEDAMGRYDVYSMMVLGFQNPWVSFFYIVAILFLAFHLSHGISSMFQSMGWNAPRFQKPLDIIAVTVAVVIFIGFVSIPISILAGWVTLPEGVAIP